MVDDEILTEARVLSAYQVLFVGSGQAGSSLLLAVQLPEVKKAYRRRALDTHPDRFSCCEESQRKFYTERFIEVTNAYEILNSYVALRDKGFVFAQERAREDAPIQRDRAAPPRGPRPAPPRDDHTRNTSSFAFWERGVPGRQLRFGEFLYYSRVISWRSLIGALVWQRSQRPRIGEIARKWRWFTEDEILSLLRGRRPGERLGEVMLRCRRISPFQLQVLLSHQRKFQTRIGEYFLRQGCLTESQLRRYLQQQTQHNLRFHAGSTGNHRRWNSTSA